MNITNMEENEEKEKKKKIAVMILLFLVLLLCIVSSTMAQREIIEQTKAEKEILQMFLNVTDKEQVIEYGSNYIELGAVAWYDNQNVSDIIIIDKSELNLNKIGTYTVKYIIKIDDVEKVLERIVKVVDTKPPKITLKGGNKIILITGSAYEEPGFIATDNYDGNITNKVKVTSTVNTNKAGIYYLTYTVIDQSGNRTTIQRKIIVQDIIEPTQPSAEIPVEQQIEVPVEQPAQPQVELPVQPPVEVESYLVIELSGNNSIYLEAKNSTYIEPGALVKDNYGNIVQTNLEITGSVNPNLIGEYEIIYTATDETGKNASVTRTVIVQDTLGPVLSVNPIAITLDINSNWDYMDGVTAVDLYDGDVTANIQYTGVLDLTIVGDYTLEYFVIDSSGNISNKITRTIHVKTGVPPVITLDPSNIYTVEVFSPKPTIVITVEDKLGQVVTNITIDDSAVNMNVIGSYPIIITATDQFGITSTTTVMINVVFTTNPVITLTDEGIDTVLEIGTSYTEIGYKGESAYYGDITSDVVVTGTINHNQVGTYVLTYSLTDVSGNQADLKTRNIKIVDTTSPSLTIVQNPIDIVWTANYDPLSNITVADNSNGSTTTTYSSMPTFTSNVLGSYNITYTATDDVGNSSTATCVINVIDNITPVITVGTPYITIIQGESINIMDTVTGADDYDGDVTANITYTSNPNPFNNAVPGIYTITYDVSDSSGNVGTSVTKIITVTTASAPTINIDDTNNIYEMEINTIVPIFNATATNYLGNAISVTIDTSDILPNVLGVYQIKFTATDSLGNTVTKIRNFEVKDTTMPQIIVLNSIVDVAWKSSYDPLSNITVTDNSGETITPTYTSVPDPFDVNTIGNYNIIYTATDLSGNTNTGTAIINVIDVTPLTATISYSEINLTNQDVVVRIETNREIIPVTGWTQISVTTYEKTYSTNVNETINITDLNSISASVNIVITNIDKIPPVITLNSSNIYSMEVFDAIPTFNATGADAISGVIIVNVDTTDINPNILGTYDVIFTAADQAGNVETLTVSFNVIDTTLPVITVNSPDNVTINVDDTFMGATYTITDNYNAYADLTITVTSTVETTIAGSYSVIYTATDTSGNTATKTIYVTVVAPAMPVITLDSSNIYMEKVFTLAMPPILATAVDEFNNPITNIVIDTSLVDLNNIGIYDITITATDTRGYSTALVIQFEVYDDEPPVIIALDITIEAGSIWNDMNSVTVTDNYDSPADITINITGTVDVNTIGSYVLAYDVTDTSGNTVTIQRIITVEDTIAPTIAINQNPVDIIWGTTYDLSSNVTVTDNANGSITTTYISSPVFNENVVGSYTITYTSIDVSNNTGTATCVINVIDNTAPSLTVGNHNITIIQGETVNIMDTVSAIDDYDGNITANVTYTSSPSPFSSSILGVYTITYEVSDSFGNSAAPATKTITVATGTPPIITVNDTTNIYSMEVNTTIPTFNATAIDCLGNTIPVTIDTGGILPNVLGTYEIRFVATDSFGNTTIERRNFDVADTTKPVITLNGATPIYLEANVDVYVELGAIVTDNYDTAVQNNLRLTGTVNPNLVGVYDITYEAIDSSGNVADVVIRRVIVQDTIPPVLTVSPMKITVGLSSVFSVLDGVQAIDIYDGDATANVVVSSVPPFDINAVGEYTITYTITDSNGNSAPSFSRTVYVVTPVPPTINLDPTNVYIANVGDPMPVINSTATDELGRNVTDIVTDYSQVDMNVVGIYPVTITATDIDGAVGIVVVNIEVINNIPPVITLYGDDTIYLEVKTAYVEPGYTALSDYFGDLTANVVVSGVVNHNQVGTYTLIYSLTDALGNHADMKTRTITFTDTTKPAITLNGNSPIDVEIGSSYTELGAVATDNYDVTIQTKLVIQNNIDLTTLGTYQVTYNVTDSSGNIADEVIRIVNIVDTTKPVITLNGGSYTTIALNGTYTELGAIVTDNSNETITTAITGIVDTSTNGIYEIKYNAVDSTGNIATEVVRTIYVYDNTLSAIVSSKLKNLGGQTTYFDKLATDNYVWYSGMLFRVIGVNSDGTVKLITEQGVTLLGVSNNDWLNNYYYPRLNSPSATIQGSVGLLTLSEYNLIRQGSNTNFLNNKTYFWTADAYDTSNYYYINDNGVSLYGNVSTIMGIRPVINIKPDIKISGGIGTGTDAWIIEDRATVDYGGTTLNTRFAGEYVTIDNNIYRIMEKNPDGTTQVILADYFKEAGTNKLVKFNNTAISSSMDITNTDNIANYLNKTVYETLFTNFTTRFQVMENYTYYQGNYVGTDNPLITSLANTNSFTSNVALPRLGEMFIGQEMNPAFYHTMTKVTGTTDQIYSNRNYNLASSYNVTTQYATRPVVTLRDINVITGGKGLSNDPYTISSASIMVNGETRLETFAGAIYTDSGATAYDSNGNDISADITVTTDLHVDNVGTYHVVYEVEDPVTRTTISATREIVVTEYLMDFYYTGDYQKFTAPIDGNYFIELWGAAGGKGTTATINQGNGAYTSGYINLQKDETIYVYVGQKLNTVTAANYSTPSFNGGGGAYANHAGSSKGGGATDIRLVSGAWNDTTGLNSRIMVAGGGRSWSICRLSRRICRRTFWRKFRECGSWNTNNWV